MADDEAILDFQHRFRKLQDVEGAKNQLIKELMQKLNSLSDDYMTERLDRQREISFNREVQRREHELNAKLRQFNSIMDRNPFVLVLIDGDGMIFENALLQRAEQGGKDAAGLLQSAVKDYIHQEFYELPSDCKIVAKIYANLKGLSDTCSKAGIVEKTSTVEEFARGFTRSRHLFDFIDVGSGKDRADDKLSEVFKLHLYDCHCRQILFGCSHDNGYARLLEEFTTDEGCSSRITLLEGVPFERELISLKRHFKHTRFDSLFRSSKIELQRPIQATPSLPARALSNGPTATASTPLTWASTAATFTASTPPQTPHPTSQTSSDPHTPGILQNKYGQRIDSDTKYDKADMARVKGLKMCNVHVLRNDCPFGSSCVHGHEYKPTASELATLRHIARQQPCRFGTACEDAKCMYGHRCLGNPCSFVYNGGCRFPTEMHGVDTQVVKRVRV
ncbi:MAG: hypothetical protein M4579_001392 [Chaenotheca gracillima]|nr:MAG: hypothetical protein M4579_001392 [Chaenotheca gracillima]